MKQLLKCMLFLHLLLCDAIILAQFVAADLKSYFILLFNLDIFQYLCTTVLLSEMKYERHQILKRSNVKHIKYQRDEI